MNVIKRLVAMLLSATMLFGMVPTCVLAEEVEGEEPAAAVEQVAEPMQEKALEQEEEKPEPVETEAPVDQPEEEQVSEDEEPVVEAEPEEPAAVEETEEAEETAAIIITIKPVKDVQVKGGKAELEVNASVNAEGELAYQWQQLDVSVTYEKTEDREAAWENVEDKTAKEETFVLAGINAENFAEYAKLVYRCVVTAGDASAIGGEIRLKADPAWEAADEESEPIMENEEEPVESEETQKEQGLASQELSEKVIASGYCGAEGDGTNIAWAVTEGMYLILQGSGRMKNYTEEERITTPWEEYHNQILSVSISDGITNIGNYAFSDFYAITAVSIPSSVIAIGKNAFSQCSSLKTVNLPAGLQSIGDGAFLSCYELSELNVPIGIELGRSVFRECNKLADENGLIIVGGICFGLICDDKEVVEIPEGVTEIDRLLDSSIITQVKLPKSLQEIRPDAFRWIYNLRSINLADNVRIGRGAFGADYNLPQQDGYIIIRDELVAYVGNEKVIRIPEGVTYINAEAFGEEGVEVNSITFPASVKEIAGRLYCSNTTELIFEGVVDKMPSERFGAAFEGVTANAYYYCTAEGWTSVNMLNYGGNLQWSILHDYVDGVCSRCNEEEPISAIASGYCGAEGDGTNISWAVTEDMHLVLKGSGRMANYTEEDRITTPWEEYHTKITGVSISKGITRIGDYAFSDFYALESIVIPEGVTSIGYAAMQMCSELKTVSLPSTLKKIDGFAFSNSAIRSIVIPAGVTSLGYGAFCSCYDLSSVQFMGDIVKAESFLFDGCTLLQDHEGFIIFNGVLFGYYGSLKRVTIPSNVYRLAEGAFNWSNVETVIIPDSVTCIDNYAFFENELLKEVIFEDGGVVLAAEAFYGTNMTVSCSCEAGWNESNMQDYGGNISWNVEHQFEYGVCSNCGSLESTILGSGQCGANAFWTVSNDGVLTISGTGKTYDYDDFANESGALFAPWIDVTIDGDGDGYWKEITFPYYICKVIVSEGISAIGNNIFSDLDGIKTVYLPHSLRSIGEKAFRGTGIASIFIPENVTCVGRDAFFDCGKLKEIRVSSGNMEYFSCDGALYAQAGDGWCLVKVPEGIAGSFWIYEDTVGIEYGAFGNSRIASVRIPEYVDLSRYEMVISNDGTVSLGKTGGMETFSGCQRLKTIEVEEGNNHFSSIDGVLFSKDGKTIVLFPVGRTGTYSVPDGVEIIGEYCFSSTKVTSVSLSSSIKAIGSYAFYGTDLIQLVIPDGVEQVGEDAFGWMNHLKTIVIPSSIKEIESYAFYGCNSLEEIYYTGTEQQWNHLLDQISEECENIFTAQVFFEQNVELEMPSFSPVDSGFLNRDIKWEFYGNGELKITGNGKMPDFEPFATPWNDLYQGEILSVVISEGITSVGSNAFAYCCQLMDVFLPKTIKSIGKAAFYDNMCLQITYGGSEPDWRKITKGPDNDSLWENEIIYLEEHIHVFDGQMRVEPTCVENGWIFQICECGLGEGIEEIPATGHNIVEDPAIPASVWETGKTSGRHCAACGLVIVKQRETGEVASMAAPDAVSPSAGTVKLTWSVVSDGNGYEVYRSMEEDGWYSLVKAISSAKTITLTDKKLVGGSVYYYIVRPYKLVNKQKVYGEFSEPVSVGVQMVKPAPVVKKLGTNAIITWKAVPNAVSYYLFVDDGLGYEQYGTRIRSDQLTVSVPINLAGSYNFILLAESAEGVETQSAVKTLKGALKAPSLTAKLSVDLKSLSFSWKHVPGAVGYLLYVDDGNGEYGPWYYPADGEIYNPITQRHELEMLVSPVGSYKIRVLSVADIEAQICSIAATKTVKASMKSPALTLKKLTGDRIRLSWKTVPGAVRYEIQRSLSKTGPFRTIETLEANAGIALYSFEDVVLPGKDYFYRVAAVWDTDEEGVFGSLPAFTYSAVKQAAMPFAAPTLGARQPSGTKSITVTWKEIPGATDFRVYRSLSEYGEYQEVFSGYGPSFVDENVVSGLTYYYRAVAICDNEAGSVRTGYGPVKSVKVK